MTKKQSHNIFCKITLYFYQKKSYNKDCEVSLVYKYDDIPSIPLGSVIHFKEYGIDSHDKKYLMNSVDGVLSAIIPSNQPIGLEEIAMYYSRLPSEYYYTLSVDSQHRLVLDTGTDNRGMSIYGTIHINKYYMSVGLHELEVEESPALKQPELPHQILGFNSYDYGKKFGK